MFDKWTAIVEAYLQSSPWLAVGAVFVGGALTATAPCVLVMIPLMISYVAGRREDGIGARRAFGYSAIFVLGLAIAFTLLGLFAALAGRLYGDIPGWWNYLVAAVCVVMGLHLLGVVRIPLPAPARIRPRTGGALGAFLLGFLFGLVSSPCAAPVLVILLTYLAGSDSSPAFGAFLLFVYAVGHSMLVLVAGTSMGAARSLIESRRITRGTDILRRIAGGVILLLGVYFALTVKP